MIILLNGFIVYYLLNLLLLENGGAGPYLLTRKKRVIHKDPDSEAFLEWRATWVDYLRRVLNVYEVRSIHGGIEGNPENVWYTKSNQMSHLWDCKLCLSFWVALIITVLNIFLADILNIFEADILNIFEADILIAFSFILTITMSSAGAGVFLYSITESRDS